MSQPHSIFVFLLRQFPKGHLLATLGLITVIGLALMAPGEGNSLPSETTLDLTLPSPNGRQAHKSDDELPSHQWREVKIQSGDTLAKVLRTGGATPAAIHELMSSSEEVKRLSNIRPGDILRFEINDASQLSAVQ